MKKPINDFKMNVMSRSVNEGFARVAVAAFLTQLNPTLEEVSAYCRERRNTVDPQRWYDHYSSNGWRVGKNPMKDWKAAVRTWERSEINKPQTGFQTSNPFMEMLQEEGGNLF